MPKTSTAKENKELKTKDFRLRMTPERKKQLAFLAKREGRSQANLIDRLILEKYEKIVKGDSNGK